MPMTYEELAASPTFVMDRDGGSAQRIVKVAWEDIGRAILEVFPGAAFGYPYTASIPGFPWLRAQRMTIGPWDGEHPTGHGESMNTYPNGAKIVVDYEPNTWPEPDFGDGPDGPDSDIKDITFLEQQITFGGEYLTWPNNGVRWDKDADGNATYGSGGGGGGAGDKQFKVFEDINVGVVVPTIEHSMTWHYVRRPPWVGIRNCLGKVNSVRHMGCEPETLLFNGCTASRTYSTQGLPTWKLEYRLSEKCYNYPLQLERSSSGVQIVNGGTGYAVGDILSAVGGIGRPLKVRVTAIDEMTGRILGVGGIALVTGGAYTTIPNAGGGPFNLFGGSGTGATAFDAFGTSRIQDAQGWNHFLRPTTGRFERMVRKDGSGVYGGAQFRQLYGGRP